MFPIPFVLRILYLFFFSAEEYMKSIINTGLVSVAIHTGRMHQQITLQQTFHMDHVWMQNHILVK